MRKLTFIIILLLLCANVGADQKVWGDLEVEDETTIGDFIRSATSIYRRYYHLPLGGFDPGASGATYTIADGDTIGGWQLDNAGEMLHGGVDVHADWDGESDLTMEVYFEINAASTENDTVDIKVSFFNKGVGAIATKTQIVEVATNVGDGGVKAQYTMFKADFIIDFDKASNEIVVEDKIHIHLNLETDTSEVDDIIINALSYFYNTTHVGIESGDT